MCAGASPACPEAFYRDWLHIARRATHFTLLREHLLSMGFDYGDFDAHNALWDMAERTRHDISPASRWCPARWRHAGWMPRPP